MIKSWFPNGSNLGLPGSRSVTCVAGVFRDDVADRHSYTLA